MSKSKVLSLALASSFMFLSAIAFGGTISGSDFKIGEWSGSARTRGNTAEFSFCTAKHVFGNGIELSVARSPEGVLLLGLKNASFNLSVPNTVVAKFGVDRDELRVADGMAVSGDTMLFALPPDVGMIYSALLSTGTVLNVQRDKDQWQFDLHGVREVMTALGDCIDRQGKMADYAIKRPLPMDTEHSEHVDAIPDMIR